MRLGKFLSLLVPVSLSFVLAIATPVFTQSPPTPSLYSELRPALDDRVQGIMERQNIPGMAVVVMKDGVVLQLRGYGVTNTTTRRPVAPDTKFVIASNTKPFTAMAVMMLVEEGKLDLDTPIRQYLTDLPSQWQPLTLRQLLSLKWTRKTGQGVKLHKGVVPFYKGWRKRSRLRLF